MSGESTIETLCIRSVVARARTDKGHQVGLPVGCIVILMSL